VSCGNVSDTLCKVCSREWGSTIRNKIGETPLFSTAYYSHSVAHIILQAKENNDRRSRTVLANAIAAHIEKPSLLIPIPSSRANNRRRGYDHSILLAKEVARISGGTVLPILSVNRRVKDQTALRHSARFTNLSGAYDVNPRIFQSDIGHSSRGELVLIDDLVTTGASMREAIRAVKSTDLCGDLRAISACIATHHLPNKIEP
jgi:predicted amidophosphoribosyltransferase